MKSRRQQQQSYSRTQIIDAFAAVARPVLLDLTKSKKNCILSTRIALDVFGAFGIRAEPHSVDVTILNRACLRIVSAPDFDSLSENEKAERLMEGGAWMLQIDQPENSTASEWGGHLVCLLNGRTLVDPSSDQLSRPARGWTLPAVCVQRISPAFRSGASLDFFTVEGAAVRYVARLRDNSYAHTPDWLPGPDIDAAVKEIRWRMLGYLSGVGERAA